MNKKTLMYQNDKHMILQGGGYGYIVSLETLRIAKLDLDDKRILEDYLDIILSGENGVYHDEQWQRFMAGEIEIRHQINNIHSKASLTESIKRDMAYLKSIDNRSELLNYLEREGVFWGAESYEELDKVRKVRLSDFQEWLDDIAKRKE